MEFSLLTQIYKKLPNLPYKLVLHTHVYGAQDCRTKSVINPLLWKKEVPRGQQQVLRGCANKLSQDSSDPWHYMDKRNNKSTVFLLTFRHLLFFGTLRAKVTFSLQFSARSFNFFGRSYFQLKNFGTRQTCEVDTWPIVEPSSKRPRIADFFLEAAVFNASTATRMWASRFPKALPA